MEKNIFELASRYKYRFPFRGQISVEDLWDLSVDNLDGIFKTLNAQSKASNEESLLTTKSAEDETLSNMIDIVKYVVSVKLAEAENKKAEKEIRLKKQQIAAIIAEKKDEALKGKSLEELEELLSKM